MQAPLTGSHRPAVDSSIAHGQGEGVLADQLLQPCAGKGFASGGTDRRLLQWEAVFGLAAARPAGSAFLAAAPSLPVPLRAGLGVSEAVIPSDRLVSASRTFIPTDWAMNSSSTVATAGGTSELSANTIKKWSLGYPENSCGMTLIFNLEAAVGEELVPAWVLSRELVYVNVNSPSP